MRKLFLCLTIGCTSIAGIAKSGSTNIIQHTSHQMVDPKDLLIGRWDLTIDVDGTPRPSWLEIKLSGNRTLVGYYVGITGSARPISKIISDSTGWFTFSIPPQWERGNQDLVIEGTWGSSGLNGTIVNSEGKKYKWTAVKAPLLKRTAAPAWGKPINLFNGKNQSGWKAMGNNQWEVKNGILTSAKSGANLVSEQTFTDLKLHVEFRYQQHSNSGVYLRGRYEVQIEDNDKDMHPASGLFGGIYGFLTPSEIAALGPDQWQTYDITLIGRMVTVVANGKTVISNQEIPGITGGALDSKEGEPGPIYIQGDHGPIEYRKIVITPAK